MSDGTLELSPYPTGAFALAVGASVGALVVPAASLAAGQPAATAAVALALAVAALASRRERPLARRLGDDRRAWVLPALALPYGAVMVLAGGAAPAGVALLGFGGGVAAGGAVVVMATNRLLAERVGGAAVEARWRGRPPARRRRLYRLGAVGCVVAGVAGLVAGVVTDATAMRLTAQVPLAAAGGLYGATRQANRYAATGEGLVQRAPVQARLLPWRAFDRVEATDDAVVLRAHGWWVRDRRWDRTELDDPRAVERTLRTLVDRPADSTAR